MGVFKSEIASKCFIDLCEKAIDLVDDVVKKLPSDEPVDFIRLCTARHIMFESAWATAADIEAKFLANNALCFSILNNREAD